MVRLMTWTGNSSCFASGSHPLEDRLFFLTCTSLPEPSVVAAEDEEEAATTWTIADEEDSASGPPSKLFRCSKSHKIRQKNRNSQNDTIERETIISTFRTNRLVGLVAALLASPPTPDMDARLLISPNTLLRGRNCIP